MNSQPPHLDARVDFSASNGRSRTDGTVTGVAQPKISSGAKNTSSAVSFADRQVFDREAQTESAGVVRRLWNFNSKSQFLSQNLLLLGLSRCASVRVEARLR